MKKITINRCIECPHCETSLTVNGKCRRIRLPYEQIDCPTEGVRPDCPLEDDTSDVDDIVRERNALKDKVLHLESWIEAKGKWRTDEPPKQFFGHSEIEDAKRKIAEVKSMYNEHLHGWQYEAQINYTVKKMQEVLNIFTACKCDACKIVLHKSDCAVHNEPSEEKGICNCNPDGWIPVPE